MSKMARPTLKYTTITDKYPFDIYCVENVDFDLAIMDKFERSETKYLSGNYFIFHLDYFMYFHTLHEGIGQYELLKSVIPDLKIIPVSIRNNFSAIPKVLNISLELLKPYNIEYKDIIFLENTKVVFEKVFYYTTRINGLLDKFKIPQGKEIYQPSMFYMGGFEKIRELYSSYLDDNDSLPKKIFLSRLKLNNKVRKLYHLMKNESSLNKEELAFIKQEAENMGGKRYLLQMIRERYISLEDEIRLEQYFINNGYTVIDPEDLSFYQQINHYYNATHVAAIRGSALLNTIFCKNNAIVFILDTNQSYNFDYRKICSMNTKDVIEIPFIKHLKDFLPDQLFSVDNITSILESHYKGII